jgi:hypothetical protein
MSDFAMIALGSWKNVAFGPALEEGVNRRQDR